MVKDKPPSGGLLVLHPAVVEVVEIAMVEEIDEGVASTAAADVWASSEAASPRLTLELPARHALKWGAWCT